MSKSLFFLLLISVLPALIFADDCSHSEPLFWALTAYFFLSLFFGIVFASHFFYRRRKLSDDTDTAHDGNDIWSGNGFNEQRRSWELDTKALRFGNRIGVGNVGEVYQGEYRGRPVAIKKLLSIWVHDEDMITRFREEISLMATMNHPNVLNFVGAVLDRSAGNLCLVTEMCSKGTLYDVLHGPDPLPWLIRVKMAWEVARGMGYLHEQAHIIQRDLKTQNLLVTSHYEVKVADFGLSRSMAPNMETYCGTPATMAPEIVLQSRYDERADVFSFAIIMWELLTREDPYPGRSGLQLALAVATEGLRPPIPAYCPIEWASIMVQCWDANPDNRPSFDWIQRQLLSLLNEVEEMEAAAASSTGTKTNNTALINILSQRRGAGGAKRRGLHALAPDVLVVNADNVTVGQGIRKERIPHNSQQPFVIPISDPVPK